MFYSCNLWLQLPNHCRSLPEFPRQLCHSVSSYVNRNALLILRFPVTNFNSWFVIRMIHVSFLLQRFYSRALILCCKLPCSNYGKHLHVEIMTSQISIPMLINNELSCLHRQLVWSATAEQTVSSTAGHKPRFSRVLHFCHCRARSVPNSQFWEWQWLFLFIVNWD